MAASGERRLVFDVRGKRRHVVRAVYAVLAVLMGSSLFFVVGPLNIGELVGGGSTTSASKVLDEQAEKIERKLAKDPANEALLLSLARTRISAGNARIEVDPTTEARKIPPEARTEFDRATLAWNRYLKEAGPKASPSAALLMSGTYFSLAQASPTYREIDANIEKAAAAQRIATAARANVGTLSTLAIYEYFGGDFAAGDSAAKRAEGLAPSKMAATPIKKQLGEYRKKAKEYAKGKAQFAKAEQEKGKEALENPLGGLAGGSGFGP
jgi:hypothetical protein